MKKAFLLGAMVCALGMMTACKSGTTSETDVDTMQQGKVAPIQGECPFNDIEITHAEFDSAAMMTENYHHIRSEREPNLTDTIIFREYLKKSGLPESCFDMDECGCYTFEGTDFTEFGLGDNCCTRFHDDTVTMPMCNMILTADGYIGGISLEWGGTGDEPAYIYIYPCDLRGHPGQPYIYQTTPKWAPSGRKEFWGADGWFFVEGYDRQADKYVYHKVRPKLKK